MKKQTAFALLLVALLVLSFTGCGSTSSPVQASEAQEAAQSAVESSAAENAQIPESTPEPEPETSLDEELPETVLLDEAGVKITATGLDKSYAMGPQVQLLVENNSGKDLTVQARNVSVNGYMTDTIMSIDVVDGKKANDTITFMTDSLEACGISTLADFELSFHIFDSNMETYLDTDKIQFYTSAADGFEYVYDDSGEEVYNENGVRIVSKGACESNMGLGALLYLENNSDHDIIVQVRDVSVDGFMMDSVFSCEISAGKHAVDDILFMSSNLDENGISELTNVEVTFHIYSDDFSVSVDSAPTIVVK